MKRLIIFLATLVITVNVFGQGQVILANNSSSLVYDIHGPVAIGSMSFQLLAGAGAGSLSPVGPVVGTSLLVVGRIASTVIDIIWVPPGALATFQIQAWSSQFTSYSAAWASGGLIGVSTVFTSTTSPNVAPPPIPVNLAGKYSGIGLIPIPEPSTITLVILSAAPLLLFSRRKN